MCDSWAGKTCCRGHCEQPCLLRTRGTIYLGTTLCYNSGHNYTNDRYHYKCLLQMSHRVITCSSFQQVRAPLGMPRKTRKEGDKHLSTVSMKRTWWPHVLARRSVRSRRSLRPRLSKLAMLRWNDIVLGQVRLLAVFGIVVLPKRHLNQRTDFLSVSADDAD